MKKMKFGVLGVSGHFLKRIVAPIKQSENVEIYGLASRNLDKARETASQYSIPKFYGSYDELLKDDEIEAVFIPLPNHMHKEWIFKCMDAGKHVLCEKPLSLNSDEVIEIIEYAGKSKLKLMEAFMYRFHPKWQKAKKMVELGYIGKVTHIHTVFSYNNQDPNNIRNIKDIGGGALLDIGCYAISTARYILDKIPNRVISLISEHPDFKTDMSTSAILDFGDARALFTTSTAVFPQQEVKVFGTEGTLTVTIPFNDISEIPGNLLFENGETKTEVKLSPVNQYQLMFEAFENSIKNDEPVPLPLSDSLENIKVIDAIFRSSKSNAWETVE